MVSEIFKEKNRESKIVPNPNFDFTAFLRNLYEKSVTMQNQISFYLNGAKGAGKTSLASIMIEELGLPIYKELFVKTLPQFYAVNTLALRMAKLGARLPYIVLDDIGRIADKWSAMTKVSRLVSEIVDVDRATIPLVIITDTYSGLKHIRELTTIWVDVYMRDATYSEAILQTKNRRGEWVEFASIVYKHFMPDDLRNYIMNEKIRAMENTLENLREEIVLRGIDTEFHHYLDEKYLENLLTKIFGAPIATDGGDKDA